MSDVNRGNLNYSETTFFGQLRIAGISTILNWSIVWSVALFSGLLYLSHIHSSIDVVFINLSKTLDSILITASAGAMGVIIAALSVTTALFSKSILPMLLQSRLLHKFLFPFWYAVLLWGINVIISISLPFFHELKEYELLPYIFGLEIFLFLYAVLYTINLTGQVIRLALQNAQNVANQ